MVNIAKNEDTLKFEKQPEISIADSIKEGESLVYSKKISFADLLDPTIYFQHKFGKDSLKLVINNEKVGQTMTVDFSKTNCTMFDLPTVALTAKIDQLTLANR